MCFRWQTWVAITLCCVATSAIGQSPSEENLSTNARFLMSARNAEQARSNVAAAEAPPLSGEQQSAVREVYDRHIRPHVHDRW